MKLLHDRYWESEVNTEDLYTLLGSSTIVSVSILNRPFLKQKRCLSLDRNKDICLDIFAIRAIYFFSIYFFLFSLIEDYRFGRPGVEFYGQHTIESGENAVTKIIALPNEVSVSLLLYVYNSACWNFTKNHHLFSDFH